MNYLDAFISLGQTVVSGVVEVQVVLGVLLGIGSAVPRKWWRNFVRDMYLDSSSL